jgi:hypothetical protein
MALFDLLHFGIKNYHNLLLHRSASQAMLADFDLLFKSLVLYEYAPIIQDLIALAHQDIARLF